MARNKCKIVYVLEYFFVGLLVVQIDLCKILRTCSVPNTNSCAYNGAGSGTNVAARPFYWALLGYDLIFILHTY